MLHQLPKITKPKSRPGRGIAAGQGKTAGRGTKGQRSRTGKKISPIFEGGQTTLFQRLPKIKGSSRLLPKINIGLSVDKINRYFKAGEKVSIETLIAKKLISKNSPKQARVKVIGKGKISEGIDISTCQRSTQQASEKTETTDK